MSDTATEAPEKPMEAKDETPKEVPFTADALMQSTIRFTRQGWNLFLSWQSDKDNLQTHPIRVSIQARSEAGINQLADALKTIPIESMSVQQTGYESMIHATLTFAQLQTIIKHPELLLVDLMAL